MTIPASVQKIEKGAFAFSNLSELKIHPDPTCGLTVADGMVYADGGKNLFYTLGSGMTLVIPEGATRIARDASLNYKELVIPASVKKIGVNENGESAFGNSMMRVKRGSYAEKYAMENGLHFSLED